MTARDTTPEARRAQIEALRRLGGEGRLAQALAMSEWVRETAIEGWLARHPEWPRPRARAEMLRRVLGRELYEAAYGCDPG